jgi:O-antigen/teichoic acid export membrane protein
MSLAVVPWTFVFLNAAALKGLKRIFDSLLIQLVGIPLISIIGLWILVKFNGTVGAAQAFVIATCIVAIYSFCKWRFLNPQLGSVDGEFDTDRLLRSSIPLFWVSVLNLLTNRTSIFMLGVWGTNQELGIFSVANRTALLIRLVLVAFNSIIAPKFAELYSTGKKSDLATVARNCIKLMTLVGLPFYTILMFAPHWIMGMFGREFVNGAAILKILATAQFLNVAAGPVGPLLMMTGNERAVRNSIFLSAAVSLVLNYIFIINYGITGAALASGIALVTVNLYCLFEVQRRLKIPFQFLLGLNRKL